MSDWKDSALVLAKEGVSKAAVWAIDYLPSTDEGKEVGWKFYGTKEQLDKYLMEKHSCSCESCYGMDWWDTPVSAEYIVEEVGDE